MVANMKLSRFALYAWGVVLITIWVILWGAFVRATGSGAGCGSHWPLCDGQVLPRSPQIETLIEFTHRLTSGTSFLLVIGLLVWALRAYPSGHQVRLGAILSMVFMIAEVLIGAGLVAFELVALNDSAGRAAALALHLANTFFLLAALTCTAWWASGGERVRLQDQRWRNWLFAIALLGTLLIGMTGAVNALGDTLFPADSLDTGIQQDLDPSSHFLVRLRFIHPAISVMAGVYLLFVAWYVARRIRPGRQAARLAWMLAALAVLQLAAGAVNVLLKAPIWMQLLHLLLADVTWIVLVLLAASTLTASALGIKPSRKRRR
jgi:heme A synthase